LKKVGGLVDGDIRKIFGNTASSFFRQLTNVEVKWRLFKEAVVSTAAQLCGRKQLSATNKSKNYCCGKNSKGNMLFKQKSVLQSLG